MRLYGSTSIMYAIFYTVHYSSDYQATWTSFSIVLVVTIMQCSSTRVHLCFRQICLYIFATSSVEVPIRWQILHCGIVTRKQIMIQWWQKCRKKCKSNEYHIFSKLAFINAFRKRNNTHQSLSFVAVNSCLLTSILPPNGSINFRNSASCGKSASLGCHRPA